MGKPMHASWSCMVRAKLRAMPVNNRAYYWSILKVAPLLPLMVWQGKQIRASVPKLPEAKDPKGTAPAPRPAAAATAPCSTASAAAASASDAASLRAADAPSAKAKRPLQVIAIGESTFAGVGVATHAEGFTGAFAASLAKHLDRSVQWRVYARSGYTAKRVREKLLPKIEEAQTDLVLVGLGGNDAFRLNRPTEWRKDCMALIEGLQQRFPGVPIVFCQMPPIREFPAFSALIKSTVGGLVEMLGRTLVQLVDEYDGVFALSDTITLQAWSQRFGLTATPSDYFSDGVHPSGLTYRIWAQDVAQQLVSNKAISTAILDRSVGP